jgi:phage tail-like protein
MKRSAIRHLLPGIFQRTIHESSPLDAILQVMEQLHAPSEAILRNVSATYNPLTTPDRFVPFLARWVDLDWLFEPFVDERRSSVFLAFTAGLGRLRELVSAGSSLAHMRGTVQGLLLFLKTATGTANFEIEERVLDPNGLPRPYHIRIHAPAASTAHRALIERIIESEKPAYVTYELEFAPES